jgi:carboxypeptidase PM20D1
MFKNENFEPERGIIIAFGHDEEGSGVTGAKEIARILQARNVQVEYILDEGTFISKQSVPGIDNLIAL